MIIGLYVGFATVGVFVFWFLYYEDYVNWLTPAGMARLPPYIIPYYSVLCMKIPFDSLLLVLSMQTPFGFFKL